MNNENNRKIKRGEIYLYDFGTNEGSIQNGVRPVIVVQCDEGNQASTTTVVAALTSSIKKTYLPSHIMLGQKFGLKEPSMVMLEQLATVNQEDLLSYIGMVDSDYLINKINIGLKKVYGIWVYKPSKKENSIRCLCNRCLNDYKSNPKYVVKRLDPFAKVKNKCEKCPGNGYDYIIFEKEVRSVTKLALK